MHKKKKVFINGAITPDFIAQSIAHHSVKTNIGAHSIFLGQVRADEVDSNQVTAIEYTTHETMAEEKLFQIREQAFVQFDLTCLHIYHSLGEVKAGEICLFVFTSSKHRKIAIDACEYLVERIKKEVPIWGKELFSDSNHQWKTNLN
ncbi:molybdenum cofactor biosynthesis protein MoaE [Flavobacterium filum]|uniref:molybdenum cofactor biosynthesis protein MoaE n=1 Tax=Flavobacterium TaxID=237 RepID=UPI00040DC963|nr:molybdenum cofactor biosynthesis protein MoaE [Flavobacterium filum]